MRANMQTDHVHAYMKDNQLIVETTFSVPRDMKRGEKIIILAPVTFSAFPPPSTIQIPEDDDDGA